MDLISQTVSDLWGNGRRVRRAPSGWLYGNAVCCHHRGERPDKKGRGGILVDASGCAYNCFNCNFSAVYKTGEYLSTKFRTLLIWLGADEKTVQLLTLEALRATTEFEAINPHITRHIVEECELPAGAKYLDEVEKDFPDHVEYLKQRGINTTAYPFMVTKIDGDARYSKRIILPFVRYGKVVGYTARGISPVVLPRYINKMNCPFVFGLDLQQYEWEWTVLTEGPFDALSLDGLAVMHNVCSDEQIQLINNLGKRIIVVPHLDAAGIKQDMTLLHNAIDNGWWASIPEWPAGIKDINRATCEYGPLAVGQMILRNATNNPAKILLEAKFFKSK